MDTEAFVRWALDDARTVEERYMTELIVEQGVQAWKWRQKIYERESYEESSARRRQRALNPAYQSKYSEQSLRRTAEAWAEVKQFHDYSSHDDRPIRDIQALRFFPTIEDVHLHRTEIADVSPLADLPRLRALHFGSHACKDLRPIGRCTGLRDLKLHLFRHWPDVRGIADLPELEMLHLEGNLLVFERAVFRKAKFARLKCEPLEARSVRDLPQLPECEFLSLAGIETLDGVEAFPRLRNFKLESPAESFEPLTQLQHLTCLTAQDFEPIDVAPLARVPGLQFVCFNTWNKHRMRPVKPRDLAPLVDAPALRELEIIGNPLLETEAAAIQAGLPSWDDLYLLPEPRPLPAWRLLARPFNQIPRAPDVARMEGEPKIIDMGLRKRELRWVQRHLRRAIDRKLGTTDWCEAEDKTFSLMDEYHPHIISPTHRSAGVEFQSFGLLDKIPLVVEAIRECIARLRPDYRITLDIRLKAPKRKPTPAQIELEEKFQKEQDEAEFERGWQEREEYLARLHRYELSKQQGVEIKPEEFAPGEAKPLPEPPWARDEDEDEDEDGDEDGDGDIAVKEKPEPPPSWDDDEEHPHANAYNLHADFTLTECYVPTHLKGVAEYLFRRPFDEVIEEEKKQ
jgi:hypothetical protein